nr:cation/H+ exchanger, cation/H+ exchanger, CPA1 family [Tanacetum cinerariifolium]
MFPLPVLPTSHVSVWECRLAGDYPKSKQGVEDKDREIVARLVTDDDVELNELQLLDLPLGVLEMIMKFCIGLEYLNFRATCKSCHLAAPLLQWRGEAALKRLQQWRGKAALKRLQNYYLLPPWLMLVDKKRDIVTFEDPLSGYKYFMKSLPYQIIDSARFYSSFYCLCFSAPPPSPDCMVVGFGKEESVEVFKLNDLKNEWEKTNGIGRHMIYISDNACLCRKVDVSEMENKIFFARLYNKNGKVVFYSLETGLYHTFNAKNIEESFEDFVGTKHYPFSPRA